ncbi:hypothetical protein HK102_006295 [Quaeritorhiza haematococci]|nr:hypothetical protein HK102_006295 [Quaeritorhiza haematococci]
MNVTSTIPLDAVNSVLKEGIGVGITYFHSYLDAATEILGTATFGLIPESWLLPTVQALTGSFVGAFVGILYMEFLFQYTKFWFNRGVLKRYQGAIPEEREILTNFIAGTSIQLPIAFWRAFNAERIAAKSVWRLDPLSLLLFHYIIFFLQDTWYYFGHRFMHKNKFFWKWVHGHHHEKKNINTFSTGYAAFVENLILVGPVLLLTALIMDTFWTEFNHAVFNLAWLSQFTIFILGHSGMRMHLVLHFPWVLAGLQRVFGSYSQIPEDHEMHHIYVMSNFSLNFTFWDKLFGTYKPIEHVMNRRKAEAAATRTSSATTKSD